MTRSVPTPEGAVLQEVDGALVAAAPAFPAHAAEGIRRFLSSAERGRFDGLGDGRRRDFATGRALLLTLAPDGPVAAVCPRCGGPHGRPRVGTATASVSHGGGWTVVAVATGGAAVGVDIEPLTRSLADLAGLTRVMGGPAEEDAAVALRRWTAVEALLKADGRGLEVDPSEVAIRGDLGRVGGSPSAYRLRALDLHPAYVATLAVGTA